MKEVEYWESDCWGWDCPGCQRWNETQEEPAYQDYVECDGCGERFLPVQG